MTQPGWGGLSGGSGSKGGLQTSAVGPVHRDRMPVHRSQQRHLVALDVDEEHVDVLHAGAAEHPAEAITRHVCRVPVLLGRAQPLH
eukprot:2260978-Prymnesium_polylepis.3